jgi:DNA-directed RNA polymerase subunit H (RpoH/RPB5)
MPTPLSHDLRMRLRAVTNLARAFDARAEQRIMHLEPLAWAFPTLEALRGASSTADAELMFLSAVNRGGLQVVRTSCGATGPTPLVMAFMIATPTAELVGTIRQTLIDRASDRGVHLVLVGGKPTFTENKKAAMRVMKCLHAACAFKPAAGSLPPATNGLPANISWWVEVFSLAELQLDLLRHRDVDNHRWIADSEYDSVLAALSCRDSRASDARDGRSKAVHATLSSLPTILAHDPVVRRLGLGVQNLEGTEAQYTLKLATPDAPTDLDDAALRTRLGLDESSPPLTREVLLKRLRERQARPPLVAVFSATETAGVEVMVRAVRG